MASTNTAANGPMTADEATADRCCGALLGLACGDALGTTLEFSRPGTFAPIDDLIGGGPFGLRAGEWTDDTSMALCLAESLIERRKVEQTDQLARFLRWWRDGHLSSTGTCFDIGGQTRAALAEFERSGSPQPLPAVPEMAGNGSIMRLAPVSMAFHRNPELAIERSGESSLTTHPARACVDACRYLGGLIAAAITGVDRDTLLAESFWGSGRLHPEIEEVARGSFKRREPPRIQGSGYVVRSLEAALWAVHRSTDFRSGALLAVNLGDDADTTGAVYGQLAGAIYGASAIPARWRERLAHRELIESYARRLCSLSVTQPKTRSESEPPSSLPSGARGIVGGPMPRTSEHEQLLRMTISRWCGPIMALLVRITDRPELAYDIAAEAFARARLSEQAVDDMTPEQQLLVTVGDVLHEAATQGHVPSAQRRRAGTTESRRLTTAAQAELRRTAAVDLDPELKHALADHVAGLSARAPSSTALATVTLSGLVEPHDTAHETSDRVAA